MIDSFVLNLVFIYIHPTLSMQNTFFENLPIPIDTIPAIEDCPKTGIERNYLKVLLLQNTLYIVFFALAFAIFYFIKEEWVNRYTWIGFLSLQGLILLQTVIHVFVFPTRKYALRTHDVCYEQGKLFFKQTIVPFNRLQHVALSQGPLEKLFGLAKVKLFTAGGVQADLILPGLKYDTAEELKEYFLKEMQKNGNS